MSEPPSLIVCTPGTLGGKPRIAGRRISVEAVVIWHKHLKMTDTQIAQDYGLDVRQVHAALEYYRAHREDFEVPT